MNISILFNFFLLLPLNTSIINTYAVSASREMAECNLLYDLEKIKVLLKAASKQKESLNGIEFSIIITNTCGKDVQIFNPLDFIHPYVKNEQGKDLMINQPSKYKINSASPFRYTSFKILDVLVNNKPTNPVLDNETFIVIPKNSTFEIKISIPKVWQVNSKRTSYDDDQIEYVRSGSYTLMIDLGIGKPGDVKTITLDPLIIQYGL